MDPGDKTHQCPKCGQEAKLLVDVETDAIATPDSGGNKQYYCTNCHTLFSVDASGKVVQPPERQ